MTDEILTLRELSRYLKISPDTVYKMAQKDRIPCFKVGNKWRFKKSRIEEWLSQKERYRAKRIAKKK